MISPPIDQVVNFLNYDSEFSSSSSLGFSTITIYSDQITEQDLENQNYGNVHELIHVFFYGIPAKMSWFEEGFADYMEHKNQNTSYVKCLNKGWMFGYYDSNGRFVADSPFVRYSNFSVSPDDNADFYDPLNPSSYYTSAECFWIYINDTYGDESVKDIVKSWQDVRTKLPPRERFFVKDIVNPALGVNLTYLVQMKYGYYE